jgi:hypothetical protein
MPKAAASRKRNNAIIHLAAAWDLLPIFSTTAI